MLELHPAIVRLLARPAPARRLGPFLLVRQLGRGGFAPVWLAEEAYGTEVLRAAAVKIFALDPAPGSAPPSRRIVEEARALCRVEHRSVVRFYSLAVDEEAGVMGLGMEYVAGRSLAERLSVAGPLRPEQAIELGIALASALAAVHRAGLVHRDVKPANVVETPEGFKLIDFGIALAGTGIADPAARAPSPDRDATGRVAALQSGTLGYVDPETIATDAPASPESDLYALGATLYECITGRFPAEAGGAGIDERILDGRVSPPSIASLARATPSGLAALVERMVRPDRRSRPGSAGDVAAALERLRTGPLFGARLVRGLALVGTSLAIVSGAGAWALHERASRAEATASQGARVEREPERRTESAPVAGAPVVEPRPAHARAEPEKVARATPGPLRSATPKGRSSGPPASAPHGPAKPLSTAAPSAPAAVAAAPAEQARGALPLPPARDW